MDSIVIYINQGGSFAVEFQDVIRRRASVKLPAGLTVDQAAAQIFVQATVYLMSLSAYDARVDQYKVAILTDCELLLATLEGTERDVLSQQARGSAVRLRNRFAGFELVLVHPTLIASAI